MQRDLVENLKKITQMGQMNPVNCHEVCGVLLILKNIGQLVRAAPSDFQSLMTKVSVLDSWEAIQPQCI